MPWGTYWLEPRRQGGSTPRFSGLRRRKVTRPRPPSGRQARTHRLLTWRPTIFVFALAEGHIAIGERCAPAGLGASGAMGLRAFSANPSELGGDHHCDDATRIATALIATASSRGRPSDVVNVGSLFTIEAPMTTSFVGLQFFLQGAQLDHRPRGLIG